MSEPSLGSGSRWGSLEVLEHLGSGPSSQSYRARDTRLDREVVLEILIDGRPASEILQEARLLARILHPNLVTILGADEIEGRVGIWTEFLRGQTLHRALAERGVLEAREAALIGIDLCRALSALHAAGITHGDVSLSNVMRAEGGRIVLLGVGFGRRAVARDLHPGTRCTLADSPLFMAPEALTGGPLEARSDLYSMAAVLFALATASVPVEASTVRELSAKHSRGESREARDLRPDLSAPFVRFLQRALALDPSARYPSAEEAERALLDVLDVRAGEQHLLDSRPIGSRTAGPVQHSLPAEVDAFVGRETELRDLAAKLTSRSRLVTLQGAGGIGKTRLAVRFGWSTLATWPGGVWFCDLSKAKTAVGIAAAVGEGIGVSLVGDAMAQLGHAIASRGHCLVILDNFEQVIAHVADTVGAWSARAGDARFLVTSRERLKLPGEEVQSIDPLSLERGVELFVDRARRRPVATDGPEAETVREVVRLMDGIPLAIELAAARLSVMTPAQMVERISERFRLLAGSGTGRHATLRAAIDGSWELLHPWEKAAFAQCAVFEGGFSLDAAESVLDLRAWPEAPWVVDVIQSLVDKSMLRSWVVPSQREATRSAMRFGALVSLQDYAREKLLSDGQIPEGMSGVSVAKAIEQRHAAWFARFGQDEAIDGLDLHGGVERRRVLAQELDNLVAACRRMVSHDEGALAVALYRAASAVLDFKGPHALAVELGKQVLSLSLSAEDRARSLLALGSSRLRAGGLKEAKGEFEQALAIQRERGTRKFEGRALGLVASLRLFEGKVDEARTQLESALTIHREAGDRRAEGDTLGNLGLAFFEAGRIENAGDLFEQALAIHREIGNRRSEGNVLASLGNARQLQGKLDEAGDCFRASLAIHREVGNRRLEGSALGNLGSLLAAQDRFEESREHYQAALAILREVGYRRYEGVALDHLGDLSFSCGQTQEALRLYEKALAIHREVGNRRAEGVTLGRMGRTSLAENRNAEARELLSKGEALLRATEFPVDLAKLLCSRVELESRAGNSISAREIAAEVESIAAQAEAESELAEALTRMRKSLAPADPH